MQNETGVHKCGEMCQFKTLPVSTLGQWKKISTLGQWKKVSTLGQWKNVQPWVSGGDEAGGFSAGFAKEAGKPGSKLRSVQTPVFFINIDIFCKNYLNLGHWQSTRASARSLRRNRLHFALSTLEQEVMIKICREIILKPGGGFYSYTER